MSFIRFLCITIVIALVSTAALAVKMVRCPKTITVSVRGIQTLSDENIKKQFEVRGYPNDESTVMNLRDLLSDRIDFKNLTFILYRKNRSQCGYWEKERQLPAIDEGLENETRLYTTNGINVLRVGLHVSDGSRTNKN